MTVVIVDLANEEKARFSDKRAKPDRKLVSNPTINEGLIEITTEEHTREIPVEKLHEIRIKK